jgi:hypothetical protein
LWGLLSPEVEESASGCDLENKGQASETKKSEVDGEGGMVEEAEFDE